MCSSDLVLFNKAQSLLLQCPARKTGSYTVPNSVTSIGNNAFESCSGLTAINVDPLNGYYSSLGGVLFNKAQSFLLRCPALKSGGYTVPNSVTSIGESAFQYCSKFQSAFFLGNAPAVGGSSVFAGCTNVCYYLAGRSGWGATYAGRPAYLWNPAPQTTGPNFGRGTNGFGFDLAGTANIPLVVEATTDVASGSWTPLLSCTLTNGLIHFSDPAWTNFPTRLYRLRAP